MVIVLLCLSSSAIITFSYFSTKKLIESMYGQKIKEITQTVSSVINVDDLQVIVDNLTVKDQEKVKAYQDTLGENQKYQKISSLLSKLKKENHIRFLSIQKYTKESAVAIMDTDISTDKLQPGKSYHLKSEDRISNLYEGKNPYESKGEYGWLMSVSKPIINNQNKVVAMIVADISMQDVKDTLKASILKMIGLILISTLILIFLLYIFLNKLVIHPINLISQVAGKFVENLSLNVDGKAKEILKIDIHSKDELGQLADDIEIMEKEINNYIVNLTQVTQDKERMGTELNVATKIQSDMLPKIFPFEPNRGEFDLHALMRPAKEVGGDFYDFFMLDDDHVAIVIGDVSDKGVPAALFMVISKTLIKDYTQARLSVDKVFNRVNNELCEGNEASLFTTSVLGIFDVKTGRLLYADAGHEPLIIMDRNNKTVRYVEPEKRNFVLGGMEGTRYAINELTLQPGEVLLLYTDGVPDAVNKENESFGWDRLKATCQKHMHEVVAVMLRNILADIDNYAKGVKQFDDITILALSMITKGSEQALIEKLDLTVNEQITDKALNFIEKAMERRVIDTKTQHAFMVAVDELVSNILNHSKANTLTLIIEIEKEKMSLTFIDDSFEFNPLEAKGNEDDDSDILDKPIGGLGIFMVKKMMDHLEYKYKDGKNTLKLVKNLK
jgi:sigma-B regulation protein RsbU (phosphoserine phosphatase)